MLSEQALRVRHAIYRILADGGIPLTTPLAQHLRLPIDVVRGAMEQLHAAHAIVLDSRTRDVWMAPPFSAVPTAFRVVAGERSWFACSAIDSFAIPNLMGCNAVLTTVCPDCEGLIVHRVEHRRLVDAHGIGHFLVPASKWWDNIGLTCSTNRFFRSEEHVHTWSAQTETPIGAIMETANIWHLSHTWYDGRLSSDWQPRGRELSQELLSKSGFKGPFWSLTG